MATVSETANYPTSDGKPMAETDFHRDVMVDLIEMLGDFYADDPMTYVSGDLLMFYERGNKRRHLAPDVFVVRGVPDRRRDNYLVWEEGKGPDLVVEVTSKSTRKEDLTTKRGLYRDVLRVAEYFLFDPLGEYLKPKLQGFRLVDGEYTTIEAADGRLPSDVTGLHLEASGESLRLYSPALGRWLPTATEKVIGAETAAREAGEAAREARDAAREARDVAREAREVAHEARVAVREAEARLRAESEARREAESEVEKLRREIEALRRQPQGGDGD
jgi:Uma2 family endonuclease